MSPKPDIKLFQHFHSNQTKEVRETGHSVKTRLYEHERYLRADLLSGSASVEYQHETGHTILLYSTLDVAKSFNYMNNKNPEAIGIIKYLFVTEAGNPFPQLGIP